MHEWKDAHEKGNNSNPTKYEPFRITGVCVTIIEILIKDNIITYMLENGVFADQ